MDDIIRHLSIEYLRSRLLLPAIFSLAPAADVAPSARPELAEVAIDCSTR